MYVNQILGRFCKKIVVKSVCKDESKSNLQVRLTEDKKAVEMSKILMWYRNDFGSDDAAVITAVAG